ncbi:hypothetical protein WJX73_009834 [Symbiochloris irregularis]|uniref:Uncharacterized protein n=1 Tax=Symbiochloris irregularis TaxID=706552 RepID=A0AAW1NTH9_9CHLO
MSEAAKPGGKQRGKQTASKRLPKMPKLPMVRIDSQWFRARLLKYSATKVLVEFPGLDGQQGPLWLPSTSDRIWRGSYKGKDWKHLGDGAWQPRAAALKKRTASGSTAAPSNAAGPAHSDSRNTSNSQQRARASSPEDDHEQDQDAEQDQATLGGSSADSDVEYSESQGHASVREGSPANQGGATAPGGSPSRSYGQGNRKRPRSEGEKSEAAAVASAAATATVSRGADPPAFAANGHAEEHTSKPAGAATEAEADQQLPPPPPADDVSRPYEKAAEASANPEAGTSATDATAAEANQQDEERKASGQAATTTTAAPPPPPAAIKTAPAVSKNEDARSPKRAELQCKESLPDEDKSMSIARMASLGSQHSPRAEATIKTKHSRKRKLAPQRADPANLYPSADNPAPSPRQAPPLLAFSTWRHASSSPEPEPENPDTTPMGSPSPRGPPPKRPARRVRAPAKLAGGVDNGDDDGDYEPEGLHSNAKGAKGIAGMLAANQGAESDEDGSEEAAGEASEAVAGTQVGGRRGRGGRWGRGRGGRGRGRNAARGTAPPVPPDVVPPGDSPPPPPTTSSRRTKNARGGGTNAWGTGRGRGNAARVANGRVQQDAVGGQMDLRGPRGSASGGLLLGVQPFPKLMQALEGLHEGQGLLPSDVHQGRGSRPEQLPNGAHQNSDSSPHGNLSSAAGGHEMLAHMLEAQRGLSRILNARPEVFNGYSNSRSSPLVTPSVPLFHGQ